MRPPCSHCGCTDSPIPIAKSSSVTLTGLASAAAILFGALLLLVSPLPGIITIVIGLGLALSARGHKVVFICPNCQRERKPG